MGFSDGFNSVINLANMKNRREQLRIEAAKTKADLYSHGFNEDGTPNDLAQANHNMLLQQVQQQQQQLKSIENYRLKLDTHDIITKSISTGDWRGVNDLLEQHPTLKKVWQVNKVENINFDTDTDAILIKNVLGDDNYNKLISDDKAKKEFMSNHFIAIDDDGKRYLKDANKVAAVAGVNPVNLYAATQMRNNALKDISDFKEASSGTYGQNELKQEQIKANTELTNKKIEKTRLDGFLARLNIQGKQLKLNDDITYDKIISNLGDFNKMVLGYLDSPHEYKDSQKKSALEAAKLFEARNNNKLSATEREKLTGSITAYKTGNKLLKEIDTMDIDYNAFNKSMSVFMRALPANWSKLTPEARKSALDTIKFKSKMGEWITKYVQSISGAAVTDDEFNRHLNDAFSGKNFVNKDSIKAAFSSYLDSIKSNIMSDLKNTAVNNPYTSMVLRDRLSNKYSGQEQAKEAQERKKNLSDIFKGGDK